jgi:creatinine amidohydrolase
MKFHELTSTRLAALDRDQTIVLIPIAAVEQHGPHMPTGTDHIICTAVAESVEERLAARILLTPTVWLGASAHHLRLGSTLSAELDTYVATLCDIARSLLDDGYRRLLFVNGHGGNVDPMRMALREIQPAYPEALLAGGSYWSVAEDWIRETLEGDHKFVGHACEFETSLIMHLRPDLVSAEDLADAGELVPDQIDGVFVSRDMRQRTRGGYTGRPDLASPQKGERLLDGIVDRLVTLVEKLLSEPLGAEYRDFTDSDRRTKIR